MINISKKIPHAFNYISVGKFDTYSMFKFFDKHKKIYPKQNKGDKMAGSEYNMEDLMASKTIKLIGGPADGREFLVLIPAADFYYFSNGQLHSEKVNSSSVYERKSNIYKFKA